MHPVGRSGRSTKIFVENLPNNSSHMIPKDINLSDVNTIGRPFDGIIRKKSPNDKVIVVNQRPTYKRVEKKPMRVTMGRNPVEGESLKSETPILQTMGRNPIEGELKKNEIISEPIVVNNPPKQAGFLGGLDASKILLFVVAAFLIKKYML